MPKRVTLFVVAIMVDFSYIQSGLLQILDKKFYCDVQRSVMRDASTSMQHKKHLHSFNGIRLDVTDVSLVPSPPPQLIIVACSTNNIGTTA